MKNVIFFLIALVTVSGVQAQDEPSDIYLGENLYMGYFLPIETKLTYDDIEGTPYLQEKLTKGMITFVDGKTQPYYMRYDRYTDEVEFMRNEKIFAIDNPEEVEAIQIGDDKLVYTRYYIKDIRYDGYLVERTEGDCDFLVRKRVEYREAKPAKSSFHLPTPAKFVNKRDQWFYSCSNRDPMFIPADNTGMKEIAGSTEVYKKLKGYMKENKLSYGQEADMIKVFEFYNSMQADE